MVEQINLKSRRAYEARLSQKIGRTGYTVLMILTGLFILLAIGLSFTKNLRYGLILISPALACLAPAIWWRKYLSVLPVQDQTLNGRLSQEVLARLDPTVQLSPQTLWHSLANHWQTLFILHHLLIMPDSVTTQIEQTDPAALDQALQTAVGLADQVSSRTIEPAFVTAGLMLASPGVSNMLIGYKEKPEDIQTVAVWLGRNLAELSNRKHQNFGGIGRDWAFGYTPLLSRFGLNISLSIVRHGAHFGWLANSKGVLQIEAALENHSRAIAVVGQVGSGKSSSIYALAQRLIEGQTSTNLAYHQIVLVSATDITANASRPGDIEYLMSSLANEAAHAGHIILFLDNAEAFFSDAPGAFNGEQILQNIIQSSNLPIILALTPNGYEHLRSRSPSLASLLNPIMLPEFTPAEVMHILEDTAIGLENQNKVMIAYEALTAAYSLSDRYNSDEAYPGKATKLLAQAIPYASGSIITRQSIEQAIEQTYGTKVGAAAPAEANELLNLESLIHQRMINQDKAVSAVASALRRSRAGVANQSKPVGSFLFLGPTGVGKTELAKALAATYFKAEDNMIRLDMSEYQQPKDVSRLLSDGETDSQSLIMAVRQKPFSVVLLDEIEKAHPNILNLLLQLLDEGQLTDNTGRSVSFKDCIIIATSNAGAQIIRQQIEQGKTVDSLHDALIEELIRTNQFKPELMNRFDEVVLFRPLKPDELSQVALLMLNQVNQTLNQQNITVSLTEAAINKIVSVGYDPTFGARPLRRVLQKAVEDTVANKILTGEAQPGSHIILDVKDLSL